MTHAAMDAALFSWAVTPFDRLHHGVASNYNDRRYEHDAERIEICRETYDTGSYRALIAAPSGEMHVIVHSSAGGVSHTDRTFFVQVDEAAAIEFVERADLDSGHSRGDYISIVKSRVVAQ